MSAFLLDTSIVLWAAFEPERLTTRNAAIISSPDNVLFMSSASIWEIAIKHEKGLLDLKLSCLKFIELCIDNLRLSVLPIQWPECVKAAQLPKHHNDPFDRMIIQQALDRNLKIVTSDLLFKPYSVKIVLN